MAENYTNNQVIKNIDFKELILKNYYNATVVNCKIHSLIMINCKKCTIVGNTIYKVSIDEKSTGNFFGMNTIGNNPFDVPEIKPTPEIDELEFKIKKTIAKMAFNALANALSEL